MTIKNSLGILFALSISTLIGIGIGYTIRSAQQKTVSAKEVRQSGYMFTSPLLECDSIESTSISPFKSSLESYVDTLIKKHNLSQVSVYYRDLLNGPWIGIKEDELFSPSSLLKVPLLLSYYKIAQHNPEILTTSLEYPGPEILTEGVGGDITTLIKNKSYTVEDLVNRMIIFSDNAASHILYNHIDKTSIADPYTMLELEIPFSKPGEYMLTVRKYSSFFRILFNASYLSPEASEKALSLLSKTQFPQGLQAGVPNDVAVSHKYGERILNTTSHLNQLHDCGIIYYPQRPYLLCIMTKGTDVKALTETIASISKFTYQTIDRQIRSNQ